MKKCLLVIQNLSKSGSPLTFLHIINALKENYEIDVAVTSVINKQNDLYYHSKYCEVAHKLYLYYINTHILVNRVFPYHQYRKVYKDVLERNYDFILTNIQEFSCYLQLKKCPIRNYFYSLDRLRSESKYRFVTKRKEKMFLKIQKNDCFIALSSLCFSDNFDFKNTKFEYLLDYPDIDYKSGPKIFNTDKIKIGLIGYFCEKKNQLFALKVLKELMEKNRETYLYLMGYYFENDIEYYNKMTTFIAENKLEKNVIFIDKDYDKNKFFEDIDYLLCPSLYEGLGLVILESQYRKTPCFVSECIPKEAQLGLVKYLKLDSSLWANKIIGFDKKNISTVNGNSKELKRAFDRKILEIVSK